MGESMKRVGRPKGAEDPRQVISIRIKKDIRQKMEVILQNYPFSPSFARWIESKAQEEIEAFEKLHGEIGLAEP